jgi:hypothetical protein
VSAHGDIPSPEDVRIEPWGEGDLPLLERLLGDREMTEHVGGPESPEKIAERQSRYERPDSGGPFSRRTARSASSRRLL